MGAPYNLQYRSDTNQLMYIVDVDELMAECCCEDVCPYTVTITLNWSGNADLDLYAKVDSESTVYFGHPSESGLTLNNDAHPSCSTTPLTPEIITGNLTGPHTLKVWYNQYSDCLPEQSPSVTSIAILNTGDEDICVDGDTIAPSGTWNSSTIAYGGFDTGAIPNYASPTEIEITCDTCP